MVATPNSLMQEGTREEEDGHKEGEHNASLLRAAGGSARMSRRGNFLFGAALFGDWRGSFSTVFFGLMSRCTHVCCIARVVKRADGRSGERNQVAEE